ncbi:MAG: hypothetical protein OEP95_05585 [Myxococcales bacterium]|nr:hypothetical protein [Myxococcales bacterium]
MKLVALACLLLLAPPGVMAEEAPVAASEPGVTRLLQEIRARQAHLDRRERELDDRALQIEELEQLAAGRLAELEELGEKVEDRIAAWEESNGDSVGRLARIYASMEPERAAPILEQMGLELATQVVARMKHKDSASILSLISKERVLKISGRVAHPLVMQPADAPRGRP